MLLGPQLLKGVEQNRKWIEKQACEEITGTEDEEMKKGDSKGTAGLYNIVMKGKLGIVGWGMRTASLQV